MQAATGKVGEVCREELDTDWTLQILVSPDRLAAYVVVQVNGDGKTCPPERVLDFVTRSGVHLSPKELAALVDMAPMLGKGVEKPVRLATGQAPRATIRLTEWYVSMDAPRRAAVATGASIDTHEVSHFVSATAGQRLCALLVTPAVDGRDAFGEVISPPEDPAASKAPFGFNLGKGVALAADGTTVVATLDGSVRLEGGTLTVSRVLTVKDNVDFKIGNIDFNGDVNVAGDVLPGFKVKAHGDVRVGGVVEHASIQATGKILIRGGVSGRHSATLNAGGNIEARYLHMVAVDSDETITIVAECLDAAVSAGRDVILERGAIIGGSVRAGGIVRAALVGSEMGVPTLVAAGVDSPGHRELMAARKGLATLVDAVKRDQSAVHLMKSAAGTSDQTAPEKLPLLEALQRELAQHEEEVNAQRIVVAALAARYIERAGHVEIKRKVHANVTIQVGHYSRTTVAAQDGPLIFHPDVENGNLAVRGK